MPRRLAEFVPANDPAPVAMAGVLALALGVQLLTPQPPTAETPTPGAMRGRGATGALVLASAPTPSSVDAAQILDRPIFSPSRSAATPPAAASDVYLLGVARSAGGALATLGDRAGASATLRPGESWQGWTLSGAGSGVAVLRREGAALTLRVGQPLAAPSVGAPPSNAPSAPVPRAP